MRVDDRREIEPSEAVRLARGLAMRKRAAFFALAKRAFQNLLVLSDDHHEPLELSRGRLLAQDQRNVEPFFLKAHARNSSVRLCKYSSY